MQGRGRHGGRFLEKRTGVILAALGSAVGLGNFLRFPSQVARTGGGAHLVPHLVAFLLAGFPLAWVEWGLDRRGGAEIRLPPGLRFVL